MPKEMRYFTDDEINQMNQLEAPPNTGPRKMNHADLEKSYGKKPAQKNVILWVLIVLVILVFAGAAGVLLKEKKPNETSVSQNQQASSVTSVSQMAVSQSETQRPQGVQVSQDDWFMVLASPTHPLTEGFDPETVLIDDAGYYLDSRAAQDFLDMQQAATDAGLQIKVISAFRSAGRQQALYEAEVQELLGTGLTQQQAEEQAQRIEQKQYESDHNTGLSVDLVPTYKQNKDVNILLKTPEYQWLQQHAAEYGFILRYPEDKQDVTGVEFKPWHWRYVGKEVAQFLKENNMTLEEYWTTYFNA